MYKAWIILPAIFFGLLGKAQYPGYSLLEDPGNFRQRFSVSAGKINTIQSDFVQEKNMSLLSEKIVSKGKFWFKKENLVRMEYEQPFRYLMVINKDNVYIRDGQKENKLSAKSNKLFQQVNNIIIECVNGALLGNPDFQTRIFEGKQNFLIELSPLSKTLKTFFRNILVEIDVKDYSASGITMNEPGGDNTIIHFVNKELNLPLADALFAIH